VTRNDLQDFYSLQRGYSLYGTNDLMIMTSIPGVEKEERFRVFFGTMMTMTMGFQFWRGALGFMSMDE